MKQNNYIFIKGKKIKVLIFEPKKSKITILKTNLK